MVYKRYDSPFEERPKPEIIHPKRETEAEKVCEKPRTNREEEGELLGFLDRIGYDDMLLIGLLILLFMEEKEKRDVPLILTLAFLFLVQYIEAD